MDATRSTPIRAVMTAAALGAFIVACSSPNLPPTTEQPTPTTAAPIIATTISTSSTNTAPPAPTTTSTTVATAPISGECWIDLARQVGWPESTLGHLEHIIRRESRCDPSAYANRPSTLDNSRGLLQINSYGSLDGAVRSLCGIDPTELFDPTTNLTCGLAYYRAAGWSPWGG